MVAISLIAGLTSFGQAKQVSYKSTTPVKVVTTPVNKLKLDVDEFTGKETLYMEKDLTITNDGKKGFRIYPLLRKENGVWIYGTIAGKAAGVGSCYENEKLYFIFDDGSKLELESWRDFNCVGEIGFDLQGHYKDELNKSIKAIKLVNGRSYDSFEKVLTKPEEKNYFVNFFKQLESYNKK